MGNTRTHYSVEFKLRVLAALDANDGNIFKTSRQYGISKVTVSDWNQRREHLFTQGETLMKERRLRLGQRVEMLINQIVDSMPRKVEKAKLGDAARTLSILMEVNRMLAEEEAREAAKEAQHSDIFEKLAAKLQRLAESQGFDVPRLEAGQLPEPVGE